MLIGVMTSTQTECTMLIGVMTSTQTECTMFITKFLYLSSAQVVLL
jgi:hypothetical protein